MPELAEGARLEIVCVFTGTVGSNPTLSAYAKVMVTGSYATIGYELRQA